MITVLLLVALVGVSVVAARSVHRRRGLEQTVAQLRATARVEERTQLRNRQAFTEDLTLELRRCERSGRPASLVVVAVQPARYDQDPASEFADAIRGAVRSVDVAYRIGESELALILPDTRARGALVAAKRISERLAARQDLAASIAIGVAELGPGLDHHQVFRNAYCALLAAGRERHSQILAYSPELEVTASSEDLEGLDEIEALGFGGSSTGPRGLDAD